MKNPPGRPKKPEPKTFSYRVRAGGNPGEVFTSMTAALDEFDRLVNVGAHHPEIVDRSGRSVSPVMLKQLIALRKPT